MGRKMSDWPPELLVLCASHTEPPAWFTGRALCVDFRRTIDRLCASPEQLKKMLWHMRFEQQCWWPLSWCSAGREIDYELARDFFGLPPEPADGYPNGMAMFYGESAGWEVVPFAKFTAELMMMLMGLLQRRITAAEHYPGQHSLVFNPATPMDAMFERLTSPADIDTNPADSSTGTESHVEG